MSVMTFIGLVFDVCDIDRDAALSFFRRFVDLIVGKKLRLTLTFPKLW